MLAQSWVADKSAFIDRMDGNISQADNSNIHRLKMSMLEFDITQRSKCVSNAGVYNCHCSDYVHRCEGEGLPHLSPLFMHLQWRSWCQPWLCLYARIEGDPELIRCSGWLQRGFVIDCFGHFTRTSANPGDRIDYPGVVYPTNLHPDSAFSDTNDILSRIEV